jgi:hypothetical protein
VADISLTLSTVDSVMRVYLIDRISCVVHSQSLQVSDLSVVLPAQIEYK